MSESKKAAGRVVVKVGGAILDDSRARELFVASVAETIASGSLVVIVHGGGAQISRLTGALGIVAERVDGLRVTDEATSLATVQALRGEVSSVLTSSLVQAGVRALGVSGVDAGLLTAVAIDPKRLGLVGEAVSADTAVLNDLTAAGFTPVVATVAASPEGFLNINADAAVAAIAEAFAADAVLFLSDVEYVRGAGEGSERVPHIDPEVAAGLIERGVVAGGMLPKVKAALDVASRCGAGTLVKMASGLAENPIAGALNDSERGTTFTSTCQEAANA